MTRVMLPLAGEFQEVGGVSEGNIAVAVGLKHVSMYGYEPRTIILYLYIYIHLYMSYIP